MPVSTSKGNPLTYQRWKKNKLKECEKEKKEKSGKVEHPFTHPKEQRGAFFEKYLRHTLVSNMDPFLKAKYKNFAASIGEEKFGKDFLPRMEKDIKTRQES